MNISSADINQILELKTKLEIQPNYEFTAQYDDPKAVASLLIVFLKYVSSFYF